MKNKYLLIGLSEVPLVSAFDSKEDYKHYLVGVYLAYTDINEAEAEAFNQVELKRFEHGIEIKTVFVKA